MKVLHVTASYKPAYIYGGPIVSGSALCEVLLNNNIEIQVFTTTANGKVELPVNAGKLTMIEDVPVIYFKRWTKDHSHFSPALLKAVWQKVKQFDLIHIHAWWNTVSVLAAFIALLKGVPVVVSPRGTLSEYSFHNRNSAYKKWIHNLLGKSLLNRSYLHATSLHEETALQNIITPKGLFNIPNFIKLPAHQLMANNEDGEILKLLFLSRIEEKKGLDILLNALAMIDIPYHLTIAGTGDADYVTSLQTLAQSNNLSAHINWIGFQNEHKFQLLKAHDLLILPSYDENFGNVIIESLSTGTAVLISQQVGLANYIEKNSLGWICQTTPQSVANKLKQIFNNKAGLSRINNIAPALIAADFSEEKLLKQYTEMYSKIINNG